MTNLYYSRSISPLVCQSIWKKTAHNTQREFCSHVFKTHIEPYTHIFLLTYCTDLTGLWSWVLKVLGSWRHRSPNNQWFPPPQPFSCQQGIPSWQVNINKGMGMVADITVQIRLWLYLVNDISYHPCLCLHLIVRYGNVIKQESLS